jgi:LuxR family transcriptional regulator, maltose regulon positive regulatory protein
MSSRQAERHGAAHVSRSGLASQRRRIVASKLAAPPQRPGIVDRPVLLNGVVSTTHAPVVLVSAPAGYGKTTLLALWGERDQRPFAWVSLDAADNDPVAFVAAVLAALDRVLDLDAAITDSLKAPEPALEEVVLPSLVDACAERSQPFVLVLDDLHLVTEVPQRLPGLPTRSRPAAAAGRGQELSWPTIGPPLWPTPSGTTATSACATTPVGVPSPGS